MPCTTIRGEWPLLFTDTGYSKPTIIWPIRLFGIEDAGFSSRKEEFESLMGYLQEIVWPFRISVSSPPFQGGKMGSIPIRATVGFFNVRLAG